MKLYSLQNQAFFVLIGKVISFLFQLITPIILVRVFTTASYGLYQQILTVILLIVPFLNLSFANSLYYFFKQRHNNINNISYVSQAFILPLIFSSFIVLLLFLFSDSILNYYHLDFSKELVFACLLTLYFAANSLLLDHIFVIEGKANYSLVYFSFDKLVRLTLVLLFVLVFQSVVSVVISLSIYYFIKFLFLLFYLRKSYVISIKYINKRILANQIKYSLPMYVSEIIGKIGASADRLILLALMTSADFAIYSVGSFRIPGITILYTSVGDTIMPKLSEYSKNYNYNGAHNLWKKMVKYNAMITIPVVCFFVIIAPEFIHLLFSEKYLDSVIVFQLTISTFFIQMLGHGYILRAFAKTKNILYANIIRTFISVIVGYFLIKYYSIVGAALLYVLSFAINSFIQLIKSKQVLNVSYVNFLPWKDFYRFFIFSFIAIIFIFFLKKLQFSLLIYLLISTVSFASIIIVFLLMFNYIFIKDFNRLLKTLRK